MSKSIGAASAAAVVRWNLHAIYVQPTPPPAMPLRGSCKGGRDRQTDGDCVSTCHNRKTKNLEYKEIWGGGKLGRKYFLLNCHLMFYASFIVTRNNADLSCKSFTFVKPDVLVFEKTFFWTATDSELNPIKEILS